MDVREHAHSQGSDGYLGGGIDRQDYIPNPIDRSYERHPVNVGIVPRPLRSEGLQSSREPGNHQAGQSPIHAVREFL